MNFPCNRAASFPQYRMKPLRGGAGGNERILRDAREQPERLRGGGGKHSANQAARRT
jgi:hypothetical protein